MCNTNLINAINNRIKIAQQVVSFSGGWATINIGGASEYSAAMAQIISSNDYIIYQVSHNLGSDMITFFVRSYNNNALTGNLTLIILLLK